MKPDIKNTYAYWLENNKNKDELTQYGIKILSYIHNHNDIPVEDWEEYNNKLEEAKQLKLCIFKKKNDKWYCELTSKGLELLDIKDYLGDKIFIDNRDGFVDDLVCELEEELLTEKNLYPNT